MASFAGLNQGAIFIITVESYDQEIDLVQVVGTIHCESLHGHHLLGGTIEIGYEADAIGLKNLEIYLLGYVVAAT